ncbi:MAG: hypothetical protein EYC69_06085 [Bacteroidetes bacterium]|nr:MAG: hypothetical protein EYC69_06085 [Bacteroidota bacterium]
MGTTRTVINEIKQCKSCDLCYNQAPLVDKKKKADVMWVGLSAVKVECTQTETPLSSSSNTGKLIMQIEDLNVDSEFYKTNLVKCLPLDKNKIRYPKKEEMKSCYNHLEKEIMEFKPKIVFLLGKQVSNFVSNRTVELPSSFRYKPVIKNNTVYISIHHPSYILVYKRKKINAYLKSINQIISKYSKV